LSLLLASVLSKGGVVLHGKGRDPCYRPNAFLRCQQMDVAYLYRAYAQDRARGTSTASNFADAIRRHEIIDRMFETRAAIFG
jgi:hypothetical protein